MAVDTFTEGSDLNTSRMRARTMMASSGFAGGGTVTVGGSNGVGCGLNDTLSAQELRLRNTASDSTEQQYWNPA